MKLNKKFWNLGQKEVEAIPTSCSTQFTTVKIAWGESGSLPPTLQHTKRIPPLYVYNSPDKSCEHKFLITSSRLANEPKRLMPALSELGDDVRDFSRHTPIFDIQNR